MISFKNYISKGYRYISESTNRKDDDMIEEYLKDRIEYDNGYEDNESLELMSAKFKKSGDEVTFYVDYFKGDVEKGSHLFSILMKKFFDKEMIKEHIDEAKEYGVELNDDLVTGTIVDEDKFKDIKEFLRSAIDGLHDQCVDSKFYKEIEKDFRHEERLKNDDDYARECAAEDRADFKLRERLGK